MNEIKLSPLHQVEYAVADLDASALFFERVFGESEVERAFSGVLNNPALAIRHTGFGQTVQQLCEPVMEGLPHYDALKKYGPCVHNLCYLVDNIDNLVGNCLEAGLQPLIEFPLDDIWNQMLPPDNCRGNHQSYIMDARDALGFHLELAETPWQQEPVPPLMLPAYGPQWAAVGASLDNRLLAINVVVSDLEQSINTLRAVFGSNVTILRDAQATDNEAIRVAVVKLGEVVMSYLQPMDGTTELAAFLKNRGPAVHSLVAEVKNLGEVGAKCNAMNVRCDVPTSALLAGLNDTQQSTAQFLQVHALNTIGVEFTLCQVPGS